MKNGNHMCICRDSNPPYHLNQPVTGLSKYMVMW